MTPLTFPINCIMEWNNNKVTDHNRDALAVSVEPIELSKRMANGTLRKYFIADKRTFSTSWSDVPSLSSATVDGFWGGRDMETFYKTQKGSFNLKLTYGDGTTEVISVVMTRFSHSITARNGTFELWDIDVEIEEV